MTAALIAGFLWVLLGAVTAMMPMRHQRWTGLPLLVAAPVLIYLIGRDYGWWVSGIALFAFISMFRHPLRYLWKRARGQSVELPPEMRKNPEL